MKAKIETIIKVPEDKMWTELQKVLALKHVAAPLLEFSTRNDQPLPEKRAIGEEYQLRISLFGLIPPRQTFYCDR